MIEEVMKEKIMIEEVMIEEVVKEEAMINIIEIEVEILGNYFFLHSL